jgi:hypothetical protein
MEQQKTIQVIVSRCCFCGKRREYDSSFHLPEKGKGEDKIYKCYDCGHGLALQFLTSNKPREYYVKKGMFKDVMKGGLNNEMVKNDEETIEPEVTNAETVVAEKPSKKEKKAKASNKAQFTSKNTTCVCSVCGKSKFCRGDIFEKRVKQFGSELLLKRKYVCRDCKKKAKEGAKK